MTERVFDPFFRTRPVDEGSGMGLASVHGIVTNSGGTMTVSSEQGKGTRFDVYLPWFEMAAAPQAPTTEPVLGESGKK